MRYYSTRNREHLESLEQAVLRGLSPDNGLYMPERIPVLPDEFFATLHTKDLHFIASTVAQALLGDDLTQEEIRWIVNRSITFDAPLVPIEENISSLELFHGPTLAFKDFGARFMSQLLGHYSSRLKREIVILVATSGDTGSAVANGFLGVAGVRVVVLYPSGKVSDIQERQFTTLGQNITAMEVDGTFDDCQRIVKTSFADADLRKAFFLTSANSINIARLIPQSFYYFHAYAQRPNRDKPVVISVPSGNFGNLTAGLLAKRMGLPVKRFIAATNVNDVVPEYLKLGIMKPRPSIQTMSNAMDVGDPSNFARLMDLYGDDHDLISRDIKGYAFTDKETQNAIKSVAEKYRYVLDPHGAVGYLGLKAYLQEERVDVNGIFLETAHPAKFREAVEKVIGRSIALPVALEKFLTGKKDTIRVSSRFEEFKTTLEKVLLKNN